MKRNNVQEMSKFTMKWLGTLFTLVGVYAISISPQMAAESVGLFSLFFFAHITWGIYGYQVNERSLIWMNVGMMPLDIYAMWIRT